MADACLAATCDVDCLLEAAFSAGLAGSLAAPVVPLLVLECGTLA